MMDDTFQQQHHGLTIVMFTTTTIISAISLIFIFYLGFYYYHYIIALSLQAVPFIFRGMFCPTNTTEEVCTNGMFYLHMCPCKYGMNVLAL